MKFWLFVGYRHLVLWGQGHRQIQGQTPNNCQISTFCILYIPIISQIDLLELCSMLFPVIHYHITCTWGQWLLKSSHKWIQNRNFVAIATDSSIIGIYIINIYHDIPITSKLLKWITYPGNMKYRFGYP
jgi:hypothetical protein